MKWKINASIKISANIIFRVFAKFKSRFLNKRIYNYKEIPIIINNFNRLEYLKQMLDWLEKAGYKKIYIIDNSSTYPPLLEFYRKTKYTVFKLDKNVGHLALWKTHIFLYFQNTYYVYSDPDILPVQECPIDVVKYFRTILNKFPHKQKVGFGLKIDDLPDYYKLREKVVAWEKQYWQKEIEKDVYDAKVDTTFALYKPNVKGGHLLPSLRTGGKYIARHLPWYIDSDNITKEEQFYINECNKSSSWYKRNELYE